MVLDLRQMNLDQETETATELFLARVVRSDKGFTNLGDLVPGSANFDERLFGYFGCRGCCDEMVGVVLGGFFGVAGSSSGKVGLVLLSLRVGEVGALVCMKREAETTFEPSEMVTEQVRILE